MVYGIDRREQNIVMAVLADIGGCDMRRRLANCLGSVMTAHTVSGDIGVIEIGRNPAI